MQDLETIDFKELEPNNLIGELISLIESELPLFPQSSEFLNILEVKKNENQKSLSFCVFMTNKCNSKFYFARENSQLGSSVVDIGIYRGGILIFTIEAKILPTPKGSKSKPRDEHEYVYGKGAAIQRFKEGKHGRDNLNNLLQENGLIAFIKENDFEFWHKKVNQWVSQTNWGDSEMLKKIHFDKFAKLRSEHIRSNHKESCLILHHFWINVD